MSDAYTLSLIGKTNPEPYEQIIVLSQKMINEAFHNMWTLADHDSPLHHFEYEERSGEYIKTDLGPPKVQLHVTTQQTQLYYLLAMNKGSLKIYTTKVKKDNDHIEWVIKDWVVAFSVTIGRKIIQRKSREYEKFKKRAGLAESNFSLAQLFIDASSTTKWEKDLSTFGDRQSDWNSIGADAHAKFKAFVQDWLSLMSENNENILGYAAKPDPDSSDFNKYAPSFPVTSIDYSIYEWLDPSAKHPVRKDNIDQNAISYLMVGSFQDPPSPVGLPYSGTFVEENGLYCMNRKVFWGSWLLKQLGKVIKMMELCPDKGYATYRPDNHEWPWTADSNLHVGNRNGADSDYVFQQSNNNSWWWVGSGKDTENKAHGGDKDLRVHETASSWASVKFGGGNEKVTVEGGNKFVFYVGLGSNSKEDDWTEITVTGTWKFEIVMSAIQDGGVEFQKVPGSASTSTKADPLRKGGNLVWEYGVDKIIEEIKVSLDKQLELGFPEVEENLLNALANQHKLFLPAAGTFVMKDPKFNQRGDLVVNLQYNGADPPPKPVKTKASARAPAESAKAPKPIGVKFKISSTHVAVYSA